MTPTTPPPAGTPPTFAPPGGQKPKSPLAPVLGIVIAVVVAAVVFGGLTALRRAVPSGVTTNGKALSNSEAREGVKEMVELMRGARAGDPSSINTSMEPKTELGKNFKAVVLKSQKVEADYAKALGGSTVGDLIDAKNLTSAAARTATRAKLETFKTASKTYFQQTGDVTRELFSVISGANGARVPQAASIEAEVAGNERGMTTLLASAEKILDFADEAKPTMEGGTAAFDSNAKVERFNALIEEYNRNATDFQTNAANALRDRQKNMSEAMRKIDSGAI